MVTLPVRSCSCPEVMLSLSSSRHASTGRSLLERITLLMCFTTARAQSSNIPVPVHALRRLICLGRHLIQPKISSLLAMDCRASNWSCTTKTQEWDKERERERERERLDNIMLQITMIILKKINKIQTIIIIIQNKTIKLSLYNYI